MWIISRALLIAMVSISVQAADFSGVVASSKKSVVMILEGEKVVGTGFFVRQDIIATNVHVISGLTAPQIQTYGGLRTNSISVLGFDAKRDLAVVRIPLKGIPLKPTVKTAQPGAEVVALGHPRGLEMTATTGSISAMRTEQDLIQTDAAVNPGNSGGPLIDRNGRVVGVVLSRLSGSEGLGFAVPIKFVESLIKADTTALTLEQFSNSLFSDRLYVQSLLKGIPQRVKDAEGRVGIWRVQSIDPDRIQMVREYASEDVAVGQSWEISARRQKQTIFYGEATQSKVCFIPRSPVHKVCNISFPAGVAVKGDSLIVMLEYGQLNCTSCTLENTSKSRFVLSQATPSDQPVATGAASAIQKADNFIAQKEAERKKTVIEAIQRSKDRGCVAAMEKARQNCGQFGALRAVYCGEAQADIETLCR